MTNISKSIFLKNTIYGVVQQGVAVLSSFILLPYMVWQMGPDHYGLWLIAKIFSIGGCMSLAELGFAGSITRYLTHYGIADAKEDYRKLYFSGLMLFSFIGCCCFCLVFLFNKFFLISVFHIPINNAEVVKAAVLIYGLSLLFQFPAEVVKSYYMSRQNFFMLRLWETLNIVVFMIVVMPLLIVNKSIVTVVIAETSVYLLFFIVFFSLSILKDHDYCKMSFRYWSLNSLKNIISMTSYLFLNNIFGAVYNKAPNIVIGIFLSPIYMTYYSIIDKIPKAIKALQGMINTAVVPFAVALDALDEKEKIKKLFLRGTRYSFLFLTPIVVFCVMYSETFLEVWVGKEYAFLSTIMAVFILWRFLSLFVAFGMSMYTQTKHFRDTFVFSLFACLSFLGILIFGMVRLKLWAVILGFYASSFFSVYIHLKILHKINTFTFHDFFQYVIGMPILGGGLFAVAVGHAFKMLPFKMNVFVLLIYAAVFYCLYLIFIYSAGLLEVERKDLNRMIQQMKTRFTHA